MDNKLKILAYDSWKDLKANIVTDICRDNKFPNKKFIFRGQSNEDWNLMAIFDRKYGTLKYKERIELEKDLIKEFQNLCVHWEGMENFQNYNDTQILSVGQHYGLPTRLLDWTYSLYIASFFAFADVVNDANNVAIWIIDTSHEIWEGQYGVSIMTIRVEENSRQKHQFGVFTLNRSTEKTLEEYVSTCAKNHDVKGALFKVLLPLEEKNIVLNDLDMMGINYNNLILGFEGCAKAAMLKQTLIRGI